MDKEKLNQTKVIKPPTREEIKGILLSLIKAIGNFAGVLFVGGIFYTIYDIFTNNGERTVRPLVHYITNTVIPFITNISSYIPWFYIRLTIIIWIFLIVAEMVIGHHLDIETPVSNLRKAVYSWHMSTKRHREGYFEDVIAFITLRVLIFATIIGLMVYYTPTVIGAVIWIIIVFVPVLYLVQKDVRNYSAKLKVALPETLAYTREELNIRELILDKLDKYKVVCEGYSEQAADREYELYAAGAVHTLYSINHRPFEEWAHYAKYTFDELLNVRAENPGPELDTYQTSYGLDDVHNPYSSTYDSYYRKWTFEVNTKRIAQERQKKTK